MNPLPARVDSSVPLMCDDPSDLGSVVLIIPAEHTLIFTLPRLSLQVQFSILS